MDIKHRLFLYEGTKELWRKVDLYEVIDEACVIDRPGVLCWTFWLLANLQGGKKHQLHTSVRPCWQRPGIFGREDGIDFMERRINVLCMLSNPSRCLFQIMFEL